MKPEPDGSGAYGSSIFNVHGCKRYEYSWKFAFLLSISAGCDDFDCE